MARPELKGLKYFPFDVGFFRDKKIRLLRGELGAEGVEVYQRLICKCYEENGYFLEWDSDADCALLAAETGCNVNNIRLIVSTCLKRSLFDGTLFKEGNVLTSRGIQRRYFEAIKETKIKAAAAGRHTTVDQDLCLLTGEDLSELNNTRVWLKVAQNLSKPTINGSKSTINEDKSPINPLKEIKKNKTILNNTAAVYAHTGKQSGEHKNAAAKTSVPVFEQTGFTDAEQTIIRHYLNHVQPDAHGFVIEKLCEWLGAFPPEVIVMAIDEAVMSGRRNLKYLEGILRDWSKSGLVTSSLVEGHLREWNERKSRGKFEPAFQGSKQSRKSRFANYEMARETDHDRLERLAAERLYGEAME